MKTGYAEGRLLSTDEVQRSMRIKHDLLNMRVKISKGKVSISRTHRRKSHHRARWNFPDITVCAYNPLVINSIYNRSSLTLLPTGLSEARASPLQEHSPCMEEKSDMTHGDFIPPKIYVSSAK